MPGTFTHGNMKTGAAVVYVGGTSIGVTLGPAEWTPELMTRNRVTSRHGESAVDIIHTGERHQVKLTLAENSIANLAIAFPEGVSVSSTRYFGRIPGAKMSTHAQQLRLRPIDKDIDDDNSEDLVIHKAVVTAIDPVGYTDDEERAFAVTFEAILDDAKADGKKFGYIGGVA